MKLNYIQNMIMAAAFAVAAASCSQKVEPVEKTDPDPIVDPVEVTMFTAGLPDSETKTWLGEKQDGKFPILWSEGDCIAVNGTASEALSKEDSGNREATFIVGGKLTAPYVAVYPASAAVSADKVKFASEQTTSEGCYDPAAALMAAYNETETSLSFNHLCAYLKISINYPSNCTRRATEATFTGNGGEILVGEAKLSFSEDGIPSTSALTAGEKSVTVNLSAEGSTSDATDASAVQSFLIALPPTKFENGFKIEFSDAEGAFLKAETSASVPLAKGVVLNAPELNFSYAEGGNSDLEEVEPGQLTIVWDKPVAIETVSSSYGRVHRLNDGRLMACYTSGSSAKIKFSSDNGKTWSKTAATVQKKSEEFRMANNEFAQLSSSNPHHPGRIIYAINERNLKGDIFPFHISICTSDDNGAKWSELKRIYSSNSAGGCYEPFVLELPDGTVQVYFADETPYAYGKEHAYQNISVIESKDGGDSWEEKRIVCYTYGQRDGMASAILYGGNIYVSIEHRDTDEEKLYPQIAYNSLADNWSTAVYTASDFRFSPFTTELKSTENYSGAPYISQTENYFVISHQTFDGVEGENYDEKYKNREAAVQICPKSEFKDGKFTTMRAASKLPACSSDLPGARWASLCPLGGDDFLAVYTVGESLQTPKLYCVRGHITTSTPEFK